METLLLNERETPKGQLVSVCDADVLGEEFENDEVSLTVDPEFYDGDPADEGTVVQSLANCTVANLVGTSAVALAVEHGFIEEENVLDLGGTRHAQLLWL
ncbi:hypothetical protein SAMN05216226_101199 [Halovenus aranensis]|jgi:hypothetical protein|uniref:DUF424 domain-containing protein n=1 Tax=Halovenus aranensis TaxID=890420 RepID=A0A1G8RZ03_9EURY|nr:DUF424 domain-containing protein [Halovenus aranensis]SDJ22187.1 hypothetical protein SAMN05216226_101199 [Halovenus aranensis]